MNLQPPLPNNELARLDALREYEILDTPAEKVFDDFTYLAAQICDTPVALISLVDGNRQWFKSKRGVDFEETSRDAAFCAYAILQQSSLIVNNALEDPRFAHNSLVTSDANVRFYAGVPLVTPDGFPIGTLCVLDTVPRTLSLEQEEGLQALSRQVMTQFEMRRNVIAVSQNIMQRQQISAQQRRRQEFIEAFYRRGEEKVRQGDYHGAIAQFSQFLQLSPNGNKAYFQRGLTFFQLGDLASALSDFDRYICFNPQDPEAYYNRGLIRFQLGDYKGATSDYTSAMQINPHHELASSEMFSSQHQRQCDPNINQIPVLPSNPNDAITIDPNPIRSEIPAKLKAISNPMHYPSIDDNHLQTYVTQGNFCYESENYFGAIEKYTQAMEQNPDDSEACIYRGNTRLKLKDYTGAIEDYKLALELDSDNHNAYIGLGNTRSKLHDYAKAIEDYNQALKLNPENAKAYIGRGHARSKLKDYTGAMEDYRQVWSRTSGRKSHKELNVET